MEESDEDDGRDDTSTQDSEDIDMVSPEGCRDRTPALASGWDWPSLSRLGEWEADGMSERATVFSVSGAIATALRSSRRDGR